ncbi:kelch-like protein 10 [Eucyclogobius newberryi]|uniref:kelch-like protein 10 n=1 Tax=Eucyclogobius newberryi TaxID=166745 RepID=UPI003B58F226
MSYQTVFEELRQQNVFCDALLKFGEDEFSVHKVILCRASPYFRSMFQRWGNGEKDFTLHGITPKVMSLVLDWIYTKSITVSMENLQEVMMAADMMLLKKLVEICFQFMEDCMCPENCIGIWKFSNVVVSPKIRLLAQQFILRHFDEVVICDELQLLTANELSVFIEDDKLNVKNETTVFEAILHWTDHDLVQRRAEFPHLLTKVRFAQMPLEFVQNRVRNHALVRDDSNCIDNENPLHRARLPGAFLLAIGGWSDRNPTNSIEAYDFKVNRWANFKCIDERPRAYHGSVFFNGSVYSVGGFDGNEHFNIVRRLDLTTNTWHEMPPMYYRRCYVSVAVLNGCIYAIGGYNGQIRLNTAEVYNPQTNQWSMIAEMNKQRSDASCATLNGKIYICGGFNGNDVLNTAECYCAETNQWSYIAPMVSGRSGVAVVAYSNKIYAVGGYDGFARLRTVEAYSPSTNSWQQVASMATTRSNFGIGVLDNRIFAVGGFNGQTTTKKVESYNHLMDIWSIARDMRISRSALRCCVISRLDNLPENLEPCTYWQESSDSSDSENEFISDMD